MFDNDFLATLSKQAQLNYIETAVLELETDFRDNYYFLKLEDQIKTGFFD